MRFRQLKDILEWTRQFHARIAQRFAREPGVSERAGMLLGYLADHEEKLAAAIEHFESDADSRLLNSWFQVATGFDALPSETELCKTLEDADELTIINLVVSCHDQIIHAYKELQGHTGIESVKEVLDDLIQLEQNKKILMVRDAQYLQDI